jgi:hypothetical protein
MIVGCVRYDSTIIMVWTVTHNVGLIGCSTTAQMLGRGVRALARSVSTSAPSSCSSTTSLRPFRNMSSTVRQPASEAKFPSIRAQTNLFIDGQFVPSVSGKTFKTYNPGNGLLLFPSSHHLRFASISMCVGINWW